MMASSERASGVDVPSLHDNFYLNLVEQKLKFKAADWEVAFFTYFLQIELL